ncbi:MAG: ABC transporter permease [Chloroflexi bacterium]|nr:ABC transporter permease [Chloroflexota bacterium]
MNYLLNNWPVVLTRLIEHMGLTVAALALASLIALPLGWLLHRRRRLAGLVLGVLGLFYTIPSIAMIIFLIPLLGLNARAVIVALVIYCQVILVRNVLAGLEGVSADALEAARGMGMNRWQIAYRVQLPLALPVILAGLRIAAVAAVAIATIGARFGSGGLGVLLFEGIAQAGRMDKIWIGGLGVALLALAINRGLLAVERRFAYPS